MLRPCIDRRLPLKRNPWRVPSIESLHARTPFQTVTDEPSEGVMSLAVTPMAPLPKVLCSFFRFVAVCKRRPFRMLYGRNARRNTTVVVEALRRPLRSGLALPNRSGIMQRLFRRQSIQVTCPECCDSPLRPRRRVGYDYEASPAVPSRSRVIIEFTLRCIVTRPMRV